MDRKILFVCLGNICRSPLAEAIFNYRAKESGLAAWSDSCGTANYHVGDPPDERTISVARKNGIKTNHVGRQFSKLDFEKFDLILAMDVSNYQNILRVGGQEFHHKIKMLRDFDPQGKGDVPDPYYGTSRDFDEVFEILDRSIKNLIAQFI